MKLLLSLLLLKIFFLNGSYAAESIISDNQPKENPERWFQIEVIVFQHSDLSDLKAEQWPDHITKWNFEDVIDFLSPIPSIKNTDEPEADLETETPSTDQLLTTKITETVPALLAPETELPAEEPPLFDFELKQSELPFLPLQKQYFTMADQLAAIKRSRNYRLLRHTTWRQPIFDEKQAVSVRIIGGDDFADNFNPDGTKIQKSSIVNEDKEVDNETLDTENAPAQTEFTAEDLVNAQILESQPLDADDFFNESPANDDLIEAEAPLKNDFQELNEPLPHVWELDGFIKVHLRRYLHINLDLEIKQLQQKLISTEQFNKFTNSQDFLENNGKDTGFEINWESANNSDLNLFVTPEDNNDDTLQVEYLQPYPLVQHRRVRSTEVHYFDNPILGVLVLITPYENHPKPEEEQSEFEND